MKMENHGLGERYAWIDVAKGYGILFVIWAHLIDDGFNGWIYSFHMPLFFFLSGYVFHTRYEFGDFVKRKIKTLIVPYFCLGIPMALFEMFQYSASGEISVGSALYFFGCLIVQNRYLTLWYIACLFWLNLLFYLVAKRVKSEKTLLGLSAVMAAAGIGYYHIGGFSLPWNVDACLTAIPFFAAGYCYKQYHEKVDAMLLNGRKSVIVFIGLFIINVICNGITWRLTGMGLEMFYNKYGSPFFTYLSAFAGIACIVMLAKQWTIPALRYLGENSMLYYAWHQTIMIPIVTGILALLGWRVFSTDARWEIVLYKIICVIMILAITAVCDNVIKKSGLKFALGKS